MGGGGGEEGDTYIAHKFVKEGLRGGLFGDGEGSMRVVLVLDATGYSKDLFHTSNRRGVRGGGVGYTYHTL
jgi:hypothetical protein